ncbi:MAG TPA: isochorismatase family protein [Hyphomicrobiaceae bacterium]|nr:isochorismatase family protein [Hyphomicrobiaceae bacterium]
MDDFEDHCWRDVIPSDVLEIYRHYRRETYIGENPALIAIDLYESAYRGGPRPVVEVAREFPASCGINAWRAIEPTKRLFAAARAAGLPIVYSTTDARPNSRPSAVKSTKRIRPRPIDPSDYVIRAEFAPEPGDLVITKQRASAFFGTPLAAHLTELGVRSVIMIGESTSGCLRASAVDAYSHGFHVVLVEECCFDRSELSHKVNLFDLHHKYADVMGVERVVQELGQRAAQEPTGEQAA